MEQDKITLDTDLSICYAITVNIIRRTAMVTSKRFVKTWMEHDTVGQVAQKLNLSKSGTSARATQLRKKGVKLPTKIHPRSFDYNVDELNDIINQYSKSK